MSTCVVSSLIALQLFWRKTYISRTSEADEVLYLIPFWRTRRLKPCEERTRYNWRVLFHFPLSSWRDVGLAVTHTPPAISSQHFIDPLQITVEVSYSVTILCKKFVVDRTFVQGVLGKVVERCLTFQLIEEFSDYSLRYPSPHIHLLAICWKCVHPLEENQRWRGLESFQLLPRNWLESIERYGILSWASLCPWLGFTVWPIKRLVLSFT